MAHHDACATPTSEEVGVAKLYIRAILQLIGISLQI